MTLRQYTTRQPHLLTALQTLAQRAEYHLAVDTLLQELAGITVLVARKFTNERTAEGLLEAYYLTIGGLSLGLSLADIPHHAESELNFLLERGAEQIFQGGFRHLKSLSSLPAHSIVTGFDKDPFVIQRDLKDLFGKICRYDPNMTWTGDLDYQKEYASRLENKLHIECAKWLRKKNDTGPIIDTDLDAGAVISIAVIFAIIGDGRIVARTRQKEIESLIRRARQLQPDYETNWREMLTRIPSEFQIIVKKYMDECTIIKKILSDMALKTVVIEIQNYYAGIEQDVEYD
jgi:hypothetical protein